jgi:hypothetical protein
MIEQVSMPVDTGRRDDPSGQSATEPVTGAQQPAADPTGTHSSKATLLWHSETAGCHGAVLASVIACGFLVVGSMDAGGETAGLGVIGASINALKAWIIVFPLSSIVIFVALRLFFRKH